MRTSKFLPITMSVFMCGQLLHAQEKESALDPVTITASISKEKASETGREIIIIKGERFANLPVHSIDELLRYVPGIEVQMRGPMGAQSDIVIRGGTFQQVLVILDGVRLNDANTGHFTSYIPIAPSEIDRIEVLKGASSAIYGSEAVGGVIQIITKSFSAKQGVKQENATAQVTGGEYGLFGINAGGNYSNGNTTISAGVLSNNTSGQDQRGIKGYVYNNTASVSLSHYFNEHWQLALRSSYDDRNFAAQNFYTTYLSDTAEEKVKTWWNQMQLVYSGKKDRISLDLGYKNLHDHFLFNKSSTANNNISDLFQALLTDEWKAGTNTVIVSGGQFISKKIESNDRGNHQVDQAAAFAILNQKIGTGFMASPALRLEWNERSGWELVPQVNLCWHLDQLQLRGSAGKTIRDADFTERYNNYNKPFVNSGNTIGNPDLLAERSFSYEAGVDYMISPNLKLSGTFFQRYHSRLIDYVHTPYNDMPRKDNLAPMGYYALAKNIAKVNTTGAETDIQYDKQLENNQRIGATLGFTWLKSVSSDSIPSFYITSHARVLINMNLDYSNKWFGFSINGLYKDRQPQAASAALAKVTESYVVINVKAEGFIIPQKLSVFAEADNLFDTDYADLLGAQMPGLWLMGGIKISLSK
jgi:iron complex outermembrane receptor protein